MSQQRQQRLQEQQQQEQGPPLESSDGMQARADTCGPAQKRHPKSDGPALGARQQSMGAAAAGAPGRRWEAGSAGAMAPEFGWSGEGDGRRPERTAERRLSTAGTAAVSDYFLSCCI